MDISDAFSISGNIDPDQLAENFEPVELKDFLAQLLSDMDPENTGTTTNDQAGQIAFLAFTAGVIWAEEELDQEDNLMQLNLTPASVSKILNLLLED